MRNLCVTWAELARIACTLGMLGAGIGLLLADRLHDAHCKAVGWTLLLVGVPTTVPLAFEVLGAGRSVDRTGWTDLRRDGSPV